MISKVFLCGLVALSSVFNTAVAASPHGRGPLFKLPIVLEAKADQTFSVKLRDLLQDPNIPGTLQWNVTLQPAWLSIDTATETLTGKPAVKDAGVRQFKMSVRSNDQGADLDRDATITVYAPPIWTPVGDLDLGIQNEGVNWSLDLTTVINDTSGVPTTFTATGLPKWMHLEGTKLTGTPERSDVGSYSGIVLTANGKGGSATKNAYGVVLKTVHAPKWKNNPTALPDAHEDSQYSQELAPLADNPEGTPLTFTIVTQPPPPWLQLGDTSGTLFGTPGAKSVGQLTIAIILKTKIDGKDYSDTANFQIKVIHTNHAPAWASNPIVLPDATAKSLYSQNLGNSAHDVDGDALTFKIISGPSWASIDSHTGVFSGTPAPSDIGPNNWTVTVTDPGGLSDTTTVNVKVLKNNEPPFWTNLILPEAKEDAHYQVDLHDYSKDPDGDPLTYTKLDGPGWITVDASGALSGNPGAEDLGLVKFHVKVDDKISGSAIGELQILVSYVNHPPTWVLNPILLNAKEDTLFTATIKGYATDKDKGDTLTFGVLEGPAWAQLSADGTFTGTPKKENLGTNQYTVRVTDNNGAYADAKVIITVGHTNHPPVWQNPVTLSDATEDQLYSASVASFASDPDGDALTFSLVSGPSWIRVGKDGTVSGTPKHDNIGPNEFVVRAMDPSNAFADATAKFTVIHVNHAPRWRQNPIQMPPAYDNTELTLDLSQYAVDDDGDPLTFTFISYSGPGQNWIFVNSSGEFKGIPMKTNDGSYSAVVRVSDGNLFADATLQGQVLHKGLPPVINPGHLSFDVKERETKTFTNPQIATDPDGLPLNFQLLPTSEDTSWVNLASNGDLTLTPLHKHLGTHQFPFKVDNGQLAVQGTLTINVLKDPRKPIWIIDPIQMTAKTNELFQGSVADKAKDLDGYVPLTFTKKSGPAWLNVATNGDLSGTPKDADIGDNTFKLIACNTESLCSDEGTLIISVNPGTKKDEWQADSMVPNAQAEHLWVIDNSSICEKTIRLLKRHVHVFFDTLKAAQIQWTGLYISADAHRFDGAPIEDDSKQKLMPASTPDPVSNMHQRLSNGYSPDFLGNCYNTPIYSMYRLYQRATTPDLSDIYHNGYWMKGIPMDAMIITEQMDHFKAFTKNNPAIKNYTAADFANDFIKFHATDQKAFRVSAIAPECPKLVETTNEPQNVAAENSYKVVVSKTGGKYYTFGSCDFDMSKTLQDYATRIIRRAYIHAKRELQLSGHPIDAAHIKVSLGGVELSADKWSYDATSNKITIRWDLIDDSQIKPGDKIVVEYRIS